MTLPMTRRGYGAVRLYAPERSPCRIDLSDNTSAWGMPPAASASLANAASQERYPSPYADDLKAAISAYTGAPLDSITTGCGSDDVLDSAIRALGEPGERLAYVAPTFPMIPVFARLNGLVPVATTLDGLAGTGARLIYVCSPNNPTGALIRRSTIEEAIVDRCHAGQVVIIDEAYAEFAGETAIDVALRSERVLVTRTLSKAFGLAGLRVGYAIGNPSLVAEVEKSRGPYKVSGLSESAAVAALTEGRQWVEARIADAREMRDRLVIALRDRNLEPLPSAANFVYVPVAGAPAIARRMREAGVAIRAFDDPMGLRITVAPWPIMAEMLRALDEALAICA